MIDSHCHLNFHRFQDDVDDVIADSLANGIDLIVNVGTKIDSSKHAVELSDKYDQLYAVVGVHPHHADKVVTVSNAELESENLAPLREIHSDQPVKKKDAVPVDWLDELEKLAIHPKVIAIGECGMDFFSYQSNGIVDPTLQEDVFRKQIELSIRCKLPLQIHNRHAGKDVLRILSDYKNELRNPSGVFHCFAGDFKIHNGALDLGFYIGFDGNVTYPGFAPGETVELKDIAKNTPLDRILIETDSPYLSPIPLRGTRNVPKNGIITARFIAELKAVEYDEFASQIDTNFHTVFAVNR